MVILRYNQPALHINPSDIQSIDTGADGLNTFLSVVLKDGQKIRCYHIKNE